ncbi:MAG: DUF2155 domain-containing protein [Alphaproteobacteria bacterium]
MKKCLLFFIALFFSVEVCATDIPTDIAVLRGLDKLTGRTSTFSVPVGDVVQFGRIFIAPDSCYTRPPEESPENAAFLFIYEKSLKGENIELFKGWMFSSNPALSSMEHPVYDVWVLECKNSQENHSDDTPVLKTDKSTPSETERQDI